MMTMTVNKRNTKVCTTIILYHTSHCKMRVSSLTRPTFARCVGIVAAFALANLFLAPDGAEEVTSSARFLSDEDASGVISFFSRTSTEAQQKRESLRRLEEPDLLCQRKCLHRRNKIYYVDRGAGLGDRTWMFHDLAQLAGYLCAELVLPPPSMMLCRHHNNGQAVKKSLTWQDFYNITYFENNSPAIKSGYEEFGDNYDDWRHWRLYEHVFDMKSEGSKYKDWKYIVDQRFWRSTFQELLDFTYEQDFLDAMADSSSTPAPEQGFIWELHDGFYPSDLWGNGLPPDPSDEIRERAQKAGIWNEGMRPYLWMGDTNLDGCRYTPDYPKSTHAAMIVDMVESAIHSNHPDDTIYGSLHIRRGDAIQDCDTSLAKMKEFFTCSLKGTEEVGRHIAILMATDETDAAYKQAVVDMVDGYPHVSIVDIDTWVREMIAKETKAGHIPPGMNNNYHVYGIGNGVKSDKKVAFKMQKRRKDWCEMCVPVKEILLEQLGGMNGIITNSE